ncbi:MAG TPA: TlpA disulfide reductase family protein [Thermoanaerobaculia bacterium]|nr:TlpA disulfide reductase family protein [Thermoanaerobaculia bacterium]
MLAQEIVNQYGNRVRFVVEDLGASKLADRFGVDKYPAIFVDESLVARPEDFYAWGGPGDGKYIPWAELPNRRKFQNDLRKMIDIRLGGGKVASTTTKKTAVERVLPTLELADLEGRPLTFASLRGKPVLIEFWAPWCPPCLTTMTWMKKLDTSRVHLVGVAVESERKQIDAVLAKLQPPGRQVIGTKELRAAFDGPPAVPTMVLADAGGKIVRIFYGAPANLHAEVEKELARLSK